jgi:hypothetical protein
VKGGGIHGVDFWCMVFVGWGICGLKSMATRLGRWKVQSRDEQKTIAVVTMTAYVKCIGCII